MNNLSLNVEEEGKAKKKKSCKVVEEIRNENFIEEASLVG